MTRQEIDHIMTRMLDSRENVSDLNITVGKPFQVESAGALMPVDLEPLFDELTPFQTEIFALNLINRDMRLTEVLLNEGSCDLSYQLPGKARFRVNIFLLDLDKAAGHLVPRKGKPPQIAVGEAKTVKIPFIKTTDMPRKIHVRAVPLSN